MPCFQEMNQVLTELYALTRPVVLLMHDEGASMLLVAGPTI
jgi:hypothetical protein